MFNLTRNWNRAHIKRSGTILIRKVITCLTVKTSSKEDQFINKLSNRRGRNPSHPYSSHYSILGVERKNMFLFSDCFSHL